MVCIAESASSSEHFSAKKLAACSTCFLRNQCTFNRLTDCAVLMSPSVHLSLQVHPSFPTIRSTAPHKRLCAALVLLCRTKLRPMLLLQRWLKQQSGLDINDLLSLQAQRSNLGQQSPRPALPTVTSRKIGRFLSQGFPQDNGTSPSSTPAFPALSCRACCIACIVL